VQFFWANFLAKLLAQFGCKRWAGCLDLVAAAAILRPRFKKFLTAKTPLGRGLFFPRGLVVTAAKALYGATGAAAEMKSL
jgi:hypothetical protein